MSSAFLCVLLSDGKRCKKNSRHCLGCLPVRVPSAGQRPENHSFQPQLPTASNCSHCEEEMATQIETSLVLNHIQQRSVDEKADKYQHVSSVTQKRRCKNGNLSKEGLGGIQQEYRNAQYMQMEHVKSTSNYHLSNTYQRGLD